MMRDPGVEAWLAGKPAEAILHRVHDVILEADPRMSAYLKYGTVVFAGGGADFASFVQHDKKTVSLMLHRGAKIKGRFPHLEGDGPSARFMRFAEIKEAHARGAELGQIAVAWCELMQPKPKAAPKQAR